jgi:F1F0 ATPase subunit 2
MTFFAALTTGAGAGLAYFGGLWLLVRLSGRSAWGSGMLVAGYAARLALVALTFYALGRHGAGYLLAGLLGLLLARRLLVAEIGGPADER